MSCNAEVHVGDIGTIYRVHVLDDGAEFDISAATVTELIFKLPNDVVTRKTATVETNGSPATQWFLEYQVQAGDGVGSPGEFHDNEGPLQIQGYVEFANGTKWHSAIQTVDSDGQELRIFPNLD